MCNTPFWKLRTAILKKGRSKKSGIDNSLATIE